MVVSRDLKLLSTKSIFVSFADRQKSIFFLKNLKYRLRILRKVEGLKEDPEELHMGIIVFSTSDFINDIIFFNKTKWPTLPKAFPFRYIKIPHANSRLSMLHCLVFTISKIACSVECLFKNRIALGKERHVYQEKL